MSEKDNRQFEGALRGAIRSEGIRTRGDCPDVELLGAYYERSVSGTELERLDEHFATCDRCRAQLAAIARSEQGDAPQTRSAQVIPLARTSSWRVLAPALAAVLALVVVASVLRSREQVTSRDEIAMLSKSERAAPRPVSEDAVRQKSADLVQPTEQRRKERPPSAVGGMTGEPRAAAAAKESDVATRVGAGGVGAGAEESLERGDVAAAPPAAPLPRKALEQFRAGPLVPESSSVAAMNADKLSEEPSVGNVEVRSADGTKEWIVGERGLIALRERHGLHVLPSGVATDLLAASAPSSRVCWVVGRGSTVLRTTDGEKWQRIKPPIDADFVGVDARSAERATVRSADGRQFATSDGGRSWARLPER
ncbi:MAG: zf-HC2 domain-containing protein [Candidatus Binataceae bacterium]